MNERPFHRALRFLQWFCPAELLEGIEGDLLEQFELDRKTLGERKARSHLAWNVLKFFRPSILLRNKYSMHLNQTIMIRNYVKVASRNILKRKMYSFINAFGLSIGIAFCILIYLYINDERSFDRFHTNKDRTYRMEIKTFNTYMPRSEGQFSTHCWLQLPLKQALVDEIPGIEMATRFSDGEAILRYENKIFTEDITFVDADFFKMFSFPLIAGSKEKIFKSKHEVVLTPAIAEKYFGSMDPLGKSVTLRIESEQMYTVVGIITPPPANSSLDFKILVPQESRSGYKHSISRWSNYNTPTFVQLHKGVDLTQFDLNLDKVVQKYLGNEIERWKKEGTVHIPPDTKLAQFVYTPLTDIHMKKEISWDKVSDPQYSWILGGIAILILVIACINYISLALTTSASRRAEVGIRKVVGALKNQLVYQFGLESLVLAFLSMLIGFALVVLFLPYFNMFTGKDIVLSLEHAPKLLVYSLGVTLFVGLLAGCYPALYLSAFRPAHVLKGGFTSKLTAGFTRPLVVLQFALSAFLIISSLIMYRQMQYISRKDLGFDKEQVVVIPTQHGWSEESNRTVERFRSRLRQEPSVISVAGASTSFAKGYNKYGYKVNQEYKAAFIYGVDPMYIQTLGMKVQSGRNFDERIAADSSAIIVNEALVRDMNWKDPLSEYLNWKRDSVGQGSKVIGVIKNYHFKSLEGDIEPMLLTMDKANGGYLSNILIKLAPGDLTASVQMLRDVWSEISPTLPFEYSFLDEDLAKQYSSHQRWMSIMGFSTAFAILISCLGLFGLSGINAINRTKEIGIRKVMGAEVVNIFVLLNRQYVWLALIAFTLAAPVSWYIMNKWLADFKFAITIGWELFAISIIAGLTVALVTVSYHAIRTALINPAQTLKYE